jgi:hypothetical protein
MVKWVCKTCQLQRDRGRRDLYPRKPWGERPLDQLQRKRYRRDLYLLRKALSQR